MRKDAASKLFEALMAMMNGMDLYSIDYVYSPVLKPHDGIKTESGNLFYPYDEPRERIDYTRSATKAVAYFMSEDTWIKMGVVQWSGDGVLETGIVLFNGGKFLKIRARDAADLSSVEIEKGSIEEFWDYIMPNHYLHIRSDDMKFEDVFMTEPQLIQVMEVTTPREEEQKVDFSGHEFIDFTHDDKKDDELFMGYLSESEMQSGVQSAWKTVRYGEKELGGYPIFVKKQEIIDVGGIIVPALKIH